MSNELELAARVLRLEERLSHEQHAVEQLNQVIIQLQNDIARLDLELAKHQGRLQEISDKQSDEIDVQDEKPPHY